MTWAKMPSAWVKQSEEIPGNSFLMTPPSQLYRLASLKWSGHRTSGIAALVILLCLSIRLNLSHRGRGPQHPSGSLVRLTYSEMEEMTGYARATIGKAISLLEALGAVGVQKFGRVNAYELKGTDRAGGWCQLPQAHLLDGSTSVLRRLAGVHNNRLTLEAMKLYILLLTFRNQTFNSTAIGYEAIMKYTGLRREDVPKAAGMLVALDLVGATEEKDGRHDDVKRYTLKGLKALPSRSTTEEAASGFSSSLPQE